MISRSPLRIAALALTLWIALSSYGAASEANQTLRILAGTFPMYLFTQNLTTGVSGVHVDVMIPPGMGCPHDYALTPGDMEKIGKADVFIANGLGLEEFLGEPLKRANPSLRVIDSSAGVEGVLEMQSEAHGHRRHANPHLFASPRQAARVVATIAKALAEADPANASRYSANAQAYMQSLEALDNDFALAGQRLKSRRIVTQHAVFDYLARDMGLEIVAVIEEHPGQEPSAAGMLAIVRAIKAARAAAIFTEPQYPAKVGETIAREAGIPVAVLDPVASGPDQPPLDYYQQVMRRNLDTLKRTLGYADE